MKINLLIFGPIMFLISSICYSQTTTSLPSESTFEYTKRIHGELELIKNIEPTEYFVSIDKFRGNLEKFIEHKSRVCNGEFSTVVLTAAGEKKQTPNKLSKEERKLCFREMKALQITFINNMFAARKRYLDYLHALRIVELRKARDISIKSLQSSFSKKRRRR